MNSERETMSGTINNGVERILRGASISMGLLLSVALVGAFAGPALGAVIDVELHAPATVINNQPFSVEMWFVADDSPLEWVLADVNLEWDLTLTYLNRVDNPALAFGSVTTAPADPGDVGDEMRWSATSSLTGDPLPADVTPGTLVTTFEFRPEILDPADLPVDLTIDVVAEPAQGPDTVIVDEFYTNLTGLLGSTTVHVVPEPGTAGLLLVGGLLVAGMRRRRQS